MQTDYNRDDIPTSILIVRISKCFPRNQLIMYTYDFYNKIWRFLFEKKKQQKGHTLREIEEKIYCGGRIKMAPLQYVSYTPHQFHTKCTFINAAQATIVHLIGTIEYNHIFCQCFSHIFDSLCFASTSRTTRSPSHTHGECLS